MSIGSFSLKFDNYYCLWFVGFAVLIRLAMAFLRTWILHYPPVHDLYKNQKEDTFVKLEGFFLCLLWQDFWSTSLSARVKDYFQNFLVGLFELAVFPPLIASMNLAPIGAWITLKTVAQWGEWKTDRSTFNRFLIGNALVISSAIWLATMVQVVNSGTD